uniref:Putative nonfluorescent protein n=1 Tax=Ctenophora sp. M WRF-2015 TaxID=1651132 RepID=A0A1C8YXP2_9METZ|nr:putative nonfluorescent protein [Ctenophora sp. M WRF-2015]
MDSRMERAESVFAGNIKSKLIADLLYDDKMYKLSGEGFANPHNGQHTLELHCFGTEACPLSWFVLGPIIQYPFRMFTQYTGSGMYDFFKTAFPGGLTTDTVCTFSDKAKITGSQTITFIKDTVVCRAQLECEGFNEECIALSEELSQVKPCYEVIDGIGVDIVSSTMDFEWGSSDGAKYSARVESVIKSKANFAPQRHFIAHHSKVLEKSPNNLHFSQRDKARANVINFYKNKEI